MTSRPDRLPDAPALPRGAAAGDGQRLSRYLREGMARDGGHGPLRRMLAVPVDAGDREAARTLVRRLAGGELERVGVFEGRRHDPRPAPAAGPHTPPDRSFLGRLRLRTVPEGPGLDEMEDLRTLVAVLRAGDLRQRRSALLRIADLLADGAGGEAGREAVAALDQVRDVELAYERAVARTRLGGAVGRQAREEQDACRELVTQVEASVRAFWEGDRPDEPVAALPGDERAMLLMRTRELPDVIVDHLAAVIEAADGTSDRGARRAMISSLRYAGDPRLVPSLRMALHAGDPPTEIAAAQALGRIDDPRVHPALAEAYDHAVLERERAEFAGALGALGDRRGLRYVRRLLGSHDVGEVRVALEALEMLGGTEDCAKVASFLDHEDAQVVSRAVRTLARVGDGRAVPRLAALRESTRVSALRAEIEDAEAAIQARMELRGETVDATPANDIVRSEEEALAGRRHPVRVRLAAVKDYLLGRVWLLFGNVERAVNRFEASAVRRPGWLAPLTVMALAWSGVGRYGPALAAFRRAIEADRGRVERNPTVARALAITFLRRAEEVERDGRLDIARGLLDEVLSLDLRRAPSALRFELKRRQEALRGRESAPW